jgi:DNA-binding CsgD family transcriptional regulator
MTETGARVWSKLSPRERECVGLICEGCSNEAIAERLGIAINTVKQTFKLVFAKTGMGTRLELAIFAFSHGMVPCPCGRGGGEVAS